MGISYRPIPVPDEDEFQKWRAAQQPAQTKKTGLIPVPDEDAFQSWKAQQQDTPAHFDNTLSSIRPPAKRESLRDFLTGADQGATFNLGDEIAAGGMALMGKAFGAKLPVQDSYKKLHDEAESEVKAGAQRSPFLTGAGNIAGAIGGGAATGATARALGFGREVASGAPIAQTLKQMLLQKGKNVAVGTAAGGVAGLGAGEGSLTDRLPSAGRGMLFGAGTVGGFELGQSALNATGLPTLISNLAPRPAESGSTAGRVASKVGLASHEDMAARSILEDVRRSGMSVEDFLQRARENPRAALYDLGPNTRVGSELTKLDPRGDPLVRRARGVQSVPSRGSAEISDLVNQRAESRPGEVRDAVRGGLGVGRENTVAREAEMVAERSAEAKPAYEKAIAHGAISPEAQKQFSELMATREFRMAWREARELAKDEGHKLPKIQKVKITGNIAGGEGPTKFDYQFVDVPDVRTVDYMKRVMDDVIQARMRAGPGAGGISRARGVMLLQKKNNFLDAIDAEVPAYKEARAGFADASDEIRANQLGNDFWKTSGDALEVKWPTLSDAAKQEYRKTALAAVEERLGGGANPAQLLNSINRRKLEIIADTPESYQALEKALRSATQGSANDAMIMGGSPTARILAEQADGGGAGALQAGVRAASGDLRGVAGKLIQSGVGRRLQGLSETRADALAPYLTSSGTSLVKRLEFLQEVQKALEAARAQQQVRTSRTLGVLGGTRGGTQP